MTTSNLSIGDVVVVDFPTHNPRGHEQQGYRPAVVVGLPPNSAGRFPLVVVVPMTSDREQAWIQSAPDVYLPLGAGVGGLPANSVVLVDQLRAVDVSRVPRQLGSLSADEYKPIKEALKTIFDW